MKTLLYISTVACVVFGLYSCDKDDDGHIANQQVKNALKTRYPSADHISWEMKNGYIVADFKAPAPQNPSGKDVEYSAWFDRNGTWYMTETDIPFALLPDAIKATFQQSEYARWIIDDVDMIEREKLETVYVIEVENQNQEIDLYYSADGVLIKSIADTDDENSHLPTTQLSAAMKTFIEEKYAGARIVEVDVENDKSDWDYGFTEVDIIHFDSDINRNTSKEVLFDKNGEWYSTSWDVRKNELPVAVTTTISNQYAGYQIDDAEYFEMAAGTAYYLIELEGNNTPDINIKIAADGTILK